MKADILIAGGGAAGLMAAIFAGRAGARVIVLDGAAKIGAKIIISGGGRCNVTHDVVRPDDFFGNRNQIAKVLRTFDVEQTVGFFRELGVEMKREETGKLFPVSDNARDVVDALLRAARDAGVEVVTGAKVTEITPGFTINQKWTARAVILAAGGQSVPKTGSDGSGYALARALGHSVTELWPALVPLVIDGEHWIKSLSGVSVDAELRCKPARERGPVLFTHFGLSGPAVLNISRFREPLTISFLPDETFESLEGKLIATRQGTLHGFFKRMLPERLVPHLVADDALTRLTREARRAAIHNVLDYVLPPTRDRGFQYAEVTAGGVPLSEVDVRTMASRVCPGLYLCGEILDVDGKIGGYNFQWAWSSGALAGRSAARLAGAA